jgi:hypothetical protein
VRRCSVPCWTGVITLSLSHLLRSAADAAGSAGCLAVGDGVLRRLFLPWECSCVVDRWTGEFMSTCSISGVPTSNHTKYVRCVCIWVHKHVTRITKDTRLSECISPVSLCFRCVFSRRDTSFIRTRYLNRYKLTTLAYLYIKLWLHQLFIHDS